MPKTLIRQNLEILPHDYADYASFVSKRFEHTFISYSH